MRQHSRVDHGCLRGGVSAGGYYDSEIGVFGTDTVYVP
jgi:hypothetical protein